MKYEWDEDKAESNFKKHGVSFHEAATIFLDLQGFEMLDLYNSAEEERWLRLGLSTEMRLLVLIYCERQESKRIISARLATSAEIKIYNQGYL